MGRKLLENVSGIPLGVSDKAKPKNGNSAGPIGGTLSQFMACPANSPGDTIFPRKLKCDFWPVSRSNYRRHPDGGCLPHPFSLFFCNRAFLITRAVATKMDMICSIHFGTDGTLGVQEANL